VEVMLAPIVRNILVLLFFTVSFCASAQNLMEERIRRLDGRKKSVFLSSGIFHNGGPKVASSLKAVRHSYDAKLGYERLVMDFDTAQVPRVYGHISGAQKRLYLDLFDTQLKGVIGSFGDSKFVETINLFPISDDTLSIEIHFKQSISVDIFYLDSPGRFVIDVKG
jgi:hypothetical protein